MNTPEKTMNPEQQRIAIAEACGWTPCHKGCDGKTWRLPDDSGCQEQLPDYLNDLNAMHEAENQLDTSTDQNTTGSYAAYAQCLAWAGGYSATAAQRAEAFLRTIGKWEVSND
jgi:hypothetical protein